ncbi:MAG TPA: YidC/Oxa1 family membrane protein insertase, partial [Actinomycetota bacterium]|nr:YidC/Oxa1 family membrane protein insertase [Actinomycetota bacterium]
QAKYRDDRQKLYEEQMKLFKEHDVNPAGCFKMAPVMLIQMPILFGMFMVLRGCKKFFSTARDNCIGGYYLPAGSALKAVVARNGGVFLGMQLGLSPILAYRQGGWLEALPYYIAVVVMFAVTYLQQKVLAPDMAPPPGSENDPTYRQMQSMARMMKFLPYMIVISSFSFPIGLTVYWITSSLWTVVEKSILNRKYGIGKVGTKEEIATPAPSKAAVLPEAEEVPKGNGVVQVGKSVSDGQANQKATTNGPPRGKPKGHGARKRKKKKGKRR